MYVCTYVNGLELRASRLLYHLSHTSNPTQVFLSMCSITELHLPDQNQDVFEGERQLAL
jgi:hypothetical protein